MMARASAAATLRRSSRSIAARAARMTWSALCRRDAPTWRRRSRVLVWTLTVVVSAMTGSLPLVDRRGSGDCKGRAKPRISGQSQEAHQGPEARRGPLRALTAVRLFLPGGESPRRSATASTASTVTPDGKHRLRVRGARERVIFAVRAAASSAATVPGTRLSNPARLRGFCALPAQRTSSLRSSWASIAPGPSPSRAARRATAASAALIGADVPIRRAIKAISPLR